MSVTFELATEPRFGLEVSPALVAFGEMLVLPYTVMQSVVEDELQANAALERVDSTDCPICRGAWASRCPVCSVPHNVRAGVGVGARLLQAAEMAAGETDSQALLRAVRIESRAADAAIAEYVVGSLDQHGFLDQSCAQLAFELRVGESRVARILDVIRRVGPPGVGATSVSECLLFQLDALGLDGDLAVLARAVITEHLPALAKGHLASIAKALGTTPTEIRQVLDLIRRRLRPYPGYDGNASRTASRYIIPDLIIRQHDEIADEFTVELVEPAMTRLRIRQNCQRREWNATDTDAVSESVPQARSFLAQLHDRWETMRRIAEYMVQRQKDFLANGVSALAPLTRVEVARALGLHESTVSRGVANKYALLPDRTIVPLARFFGVSGGVDEQLRKLLEMADTPMSDQQLTDLLCDAGYPIARRTVAKHRARLGFASAPLR